MMNWRTCPPPSHPFAPDSSYMQELSSAEAKGVDSLGFAIERSAIHDVEMKIRDNCYVLFIWGIVQDHIFFCSTYFQEEKHCVILENITQKWVEDATMMIGGTKCQVGMLMLAGYFHSVQCTASRPLINGLCLRLRVYEEEQ